MGVRQIRNGLFLGFGRFVLWRKSIGRARWIFDPLRARGKWMGSDKGVGPRRVSQALGGQDVEASHGGFEQTSG